MEMMADKSARCEVVDGLCGEDVRWLMTYMGNV